MGPRVQAPLGATSHFLLAGTARHCPMTSPALSCGPDKRVLGAQVPLQSVVCPAPKACFPLIRRGALDLALEGGVDSPSGRWLSPLFMRVELLSGMVSGDQPCSGLGMV